MPSSTAPQPGAVVLDHELLELVSGFVCILRQGEVIFINQAGSKMLGLKDANDAVGTAFVEYVEADYRFLVEAGWDLLAEEYVMPLKLHRTGNEMFEAEIRVRRVQSPDEMFLVEARDISKFVRSAEALRLRT